MLSYEDEELFLTCVMILIACDIFLCEDELLELRNQFIPNEPPPAKRTRRYLRRDAPGPKLSLWWNTFLSDPSRYEDASNAKAFRNLFRVPWLAFTSLLQCIRNHPQNKWPETQDAIGREATPLDILLLGYLAFIGGTTGFELMAVATNVSAQVHRQFFAEFSAWGSVHLFAMFVFLPKTQKQFEECMQGYNLAGFPGCFGSIDATHVRVWQESAGSRILATGKEKFASRAFQICVNNDRRILSTTQGFYGSYADATIVIRDELALNLQMGGLGKDVEWKLFNSAGVEKHMVGGLYCIVDGGYPNWSTLVSAKSSAAFEPTPLWKKQLESLRKDVECVFGILKGESLVHALAQALN